MKKFKVIGLMSGTSLDGLDVCYACFNFTNDKWHYRILNAKTYPYSAQLKNQLSTAQHFSAVDFLLFHNSYGRYLGETVNKFINEFDCHPDFIASHGHTIFHQPQLHFTCQIGNGATLAAATKLPVICDFRSLDVALGGQGAPLVPVGDRLLFADYDYCLNIGGFSNISFEMGSKRVAYDICPANIILNYYAQQTGMPYDNEGKMAASGKVSHELMDALNSLDYYKSNSPKSLGREWVEKLFIPLVDSFILSIEDKLSTVTEHIAYQISNTIDKGKLLITGGGAYNAHLIKRISHYSACKIEIPDKLTIDFKEALIFGFLGVLYMEKQVNCLSSVTGSKFNNIGGALYNPVPY